MPEVKLLFAAPEFYKANPKKLKVEACPVIDRTYYVLKDRIVAVATFAGEVDDERR